MSQEIQLALSLELGFGWGQQTAFGVEKGKKALRSSVGAWTRECLLRWVCGGIGMIEG